jgi:uncharacterized protein DUF262
MAKKISGAEYPLAKIFSSEFEYVIPSYQRPYAWTVDQTSELFDDLYDFYRSELDEGYFLGSIVLIKEEGKPAAEVIDGQQRLTTLTILLAALAARSAPDDRALLKNYIVEAGNKFEQLAAKPRLTLRERDKEFFAKYVQTLRFDELLDLNAESLQNESRKNIQANARLLLSRIDRSFNGDLSSLEGFVGFLLQRCFLVAVSTPSQQSAFRVFSVMNSRGLDLQPTDIIKADIIGAIESSEEQELYNEKWEDMEVELGRAGFNDLFAYVRMVTPAKKPRKPCWKSSGNMFCLTYRQLKLWSMKCWNPTLKPCRFCVPQATRQRWMLKRLIPTCAGWTESTTLTGCQQPCSSCPNKRTDPITFCGLWRSLNGLLPVCI